MSIIKRKASDVYYDNAISGLTADDVKRAIDELDVNIEAEDLFNRAGTVISPTNAGDDLSMGTGKYLAGSNTEIYEDTGDTIIENTSATNDILLKLAESAGITSLQLKNALAEIIVQMDSDGTIEYNPGKNGVSEIKKADGTTVIKQNSVGDSYFNQNANIIIGDPTVYSVHNIGFVNARGEIQGVTTEVTGATYSISEDDRHLAVTRTATGGCVITFPNAQKIDGRTIDVRDSGNNSAVNNITIYDDSGTPVLLFTINTNGINLTIRYSSVDGWVII